MTARATATLAAVLVLALGGAAPALAAPANDDLANATLIATLPFADSVDTTEATDEPDEPHECAGIGSTVWYRIAPAVETIVRFSTAGSDYDTVLALYAGNLAAPVGCNDDSGGTLQSRLVGRLAAGTTYYVQAGGYFGDVGALTLHAEPVTAAANDDLSAALVIPSAPYHHVTSTDGATTETDEPSPCGGIAATLWYSFTASEARAIIVETLGSTFDTVVAVYSGGLSLVGCNDDHAGLQSRVRFESQPGSTYLIQVGGYYGDVGDLDLSVLAPEVPSNDDFASAVEIGSLPFSAEVETLGASTEPGEPSGSCFGSLGATVWYRLRPTEPGVVNVDTFQSDYFAVASVYVGEDLKSLVPVACALFTDLQPVALAPGLTYHIQVGDFDAQGGIARLSVG